MRHPDASRWRLSILGVEPLAIDLGVCAARRNVTLAGIYDADHHAALLASLRIGCNAYATSAEACLGANIVVGGELPSSESESILRLRLGSCGEIVCSEAQLGWAQEFTRFIGLDATVQTGVLGA